MFHHRLSEEPQVKGKSLTLPPHLDVGTNRTVSDYFFGMFGFVGFFNYSFFIYLVKADTCFIYFRLVQHAKNTI